MAASDSDTDGNDTMWTRHLTLNTLRVTIEEDYHAGIGGTLWEGAILMARWMSCPETFLVDRFRGGRLIELGAGVAGIPGIVAAQLGCFREVFITDIEECMERLNENVLSNSAGKYDIVTNTKAQPPQMLGSASMNGSQKLPNFSTAPAPTSHLSNLSGVPGSNATTEIANMERSNACTAVQAETALATDMTATVSTLRQCNIDDAAPSSASSASSPSAIDASVEAYQETAGHYLSNTPSARDADNGTASTSQRQQAEAEAAARRTEVHVCELDWLSGCDHLGEPRFDVVLVADVLYAEELVEPLLQCMVKLACPDSLVAIAIYNRSARVSAKFWRVLPQYFRSHRKVPEVQFHSPAQADDIGIFLLFSH